MSATENLAEIRERMAKSEKLAGRAAGSTQLVTVSKTFDADDIRPVLQAGQRVFGENRVQEAQGKWPQLKAEFTDVELHLIGPLQSNKTADAVALFDVIQSIDRDKIAKAIAKEMKAQARTLQLFVQVNIGEEDQKAGIAISETVAFVNRCRDDYGLSVSGLMCIPPFDENSGPYFALLAKLAEECGVEHVSMGMSGDFETAIELGATHVRVGSAIFGSRA